MSFKRIMSALLCICLTFGIMLFAASCDNNEDPTQAPTNTPTEAPTQEPTDTPTEDPTEPPVDNVTYTVTVEDFEGNKVSGVTVEIYQGETCVASGDTNDKGKFTAELAEADDYTAKISKADGYVFDNEAVSFDGETKLEFTLEAAVEYKITVLDQFTDLAIGGVTIEFYNSSDELAATCVTGEDGKASVFMVERSYTVVLTNVPTKYQNNDTYLLDSTEYEKTIYLADPSDYEANGSREETPLIVYNRDVITIEVGKTLYCRSTRTPGFVLTISSGAENVKIIYNGEEYLPEGGAITIQFAPQLDDNGDPVDVYYAMPNDFAIVNTGDASVTVKLSIVDANDAPGTEANPFDMVLGAETTTPEFIIGTSLANPGIGRYYYIFDATESGFFWVDSLDAAVCILLNGVVVQDDNYNQLMYVFLSAGDKVDVHIETLNLHDDFTIPVSFTANFDTTITVIPDRFTCEHEYDNDCDTECNKCESVRYTTHTEQEIPATDATCSEVGLAAGVKCSVCGEILVEQQEIEKLPHTVKTVSGYNSTCSKTGLTDGEECSVCGEVLVAQQQIDKLPHTPKTVYGYDATCTQTGLTDGKICSVCAEIIQEQLTTEALDHDWSGVYLSDADGHWKTCARACGEATEKQEHELDESGLCVCGYGCEHTSVVWSVQKAASCTETGLKIATCEKCGLGVDSEIIEKTKHTPGAAATCTTDQTCTACGKVLAEAGHIPGDEATCTTNQTCSVCGEVLARGRHIPGDEATCTTDQTCTVCGEVLAEAKHTPGAAATCNTDQTCTACGEVLTAATGEHTPDREKATCEFGINCTACGTEIEGPAPHSPNIDEATCAYQKICIVCWTVIEPYKDHTPSENEATCTTPQICTACGYEIVPALGHSFDSNYVCGTCGYESPENTYKITVTDTSSGVLVSNVTLIFRDFETGEIFHTAVTDKNGYVEFTTKAAATATIELADLPEGYMNTETYLVGEESAFGFEYTIQIMNEADYIYDGRDEDHPYNIPLNNGVVTVASGATIYCSYPRSAGMTMTIRGAAGITVMYNGVAYTANSNGIITVKFASQGGSIEYSEPCYFAIINNTGAEITLEPTVA